MVEPNTKLVDDMWVSLFTLPMNAFYAPLATSLNFTWTDRVSTASVDGETIFYNPEFFNKLTPDQRLFVLMHEVDHVARLHHVRQGSRDGSIWNQACDYEINNELVKTIDPKTKRLIYDVVGLNLLLNHKYDDMSAEEIYDILYEEQFGKGGMPKPNQLDGDLEPQGVGKDIPHTDIINRVVGAKTLADQNPRKGYGNTPGYLDKLIKKYTRPVIQWEKHLNIFMTDLGERDFSWKKPNRRHEEFYLPSLLPEEGLAHIVFFYDVSGSVSDSQITRFNTEVAHIHKYFSPEKLTVVTFDTSIRNIFEFTKDSHLGDIRVTGGGGTCLKCVYDYLVTVKPTAAVIFTDLQCEGIKDPKVPILWGVTGDSKYFDPKFGTQIPIPYEE